MTTPTTVTDLFVSPRSWPVWPDAVGVSVKIVGRWGKPARQLYVGKGGTLSFIDGNGDYKTQKNIQDGATLTGQFSAILSANGAVASTAFDILIQE